MKKQQILQTRKQAELLRNTEQQVFDKIQKRQRDAKKIAAERKIIANNMIGETKQIETNVRDLSELRRLREALTSEIETES